MWMCLHFTMLDFSFSLFFCLNFPSYPSVEYKILISYRATQLIQRIDVKNIEWDKIGSKESAYSTIKKGESKGSMHVKHLTRFIWSLFCYCFQNQHNEPKIWHEKRLKISYRSPVAFSVWFCFCFITFDDATESTKFLIWM